MASKVTRREFIRDGVAAFTLSFAAPAFLVDIARAQGAVSRNLVVIYLARRQRRAEHAGAAYRSVLLQPPARRSPCPPGRCCRSAATASGKRARPASAADRAADDLQPGTSGHRPARRLSELEPLALPGARHLGHRRSGQLRRHGMARTLSRFDSAAASIRSSGWNTSGATYRARCTARTSRVPSITDPRSYSFASPNSGAEAINERNAAIRLASSRRLGSSEPRVRQHERAWKRSRRSIASARSSTTSRR